MPSSTLLRVKVSNAAMHAACQWMLRLHFIIGTWLRYAAVTTATAGTDVVGDADVIMSLTGGGRYDEGLSVKRSGTEERLGISF